MGFVQYDPKKVTMAVGPAGSAITVRGFADGEMINIDYAEDNRSMHIGTIGEGRHIKNQNLSGTCSFKLADYSPTNTAFQAFHVGDIECQITITDKTSNGSGFFAASCMVRKVPALARGKEATEPEWIFQFVNGSINHAGAKETA
jgi:hypothetical protein